MDAWGLRGRGMRSVVIAPAGPNPPCPWPSLPSHPCRVFCRVRQNVSLSLPVSVPHANAVGWTTDARWMFPLLVALVRDILARPPRCW
ncbi:hypothetical protein VFPFJ_09137 [Purpureocillium lilacinum]|uniref:Uncharacterized protein n=1 Tax=Purpureocillium lilacinum TaxID=33203 RepID=A0A179GZL4_PURLI|nr:hypothetical protein VFPFJ_09137 [Purpureocillium lilacinum]OAQ83334.1 hypothetical protein VFPFJ_09137 [Purpureocillium lilacinum]